MRHAVVVRLGHYLSARGPKLLKDLVSLMTGQLATMVLGFVAFSYLARRLTTDQYGSLEFIVSVAAFAAIVVEFGAGMIGVREIARDPSRASVVAGAVALARISVAAVVVPLVVLSAYLVDLPGAMRTVMAIYALSLVLAPMKQDWLLQAHERMKLAAYAQPVRGGIFALAVLLWVSGPDDVLGVAWAEVASVMVVTAYYLVAQFVWTVPFRWSEAPALVGFFLREGMAIGLSNMLWAFMLYVPMFILVTVGGNIDANAWLGAAQRLVIAMVTMSFLYHFNIYPVITRTVINDRAAWLKLTRASIRLVAWGAIGIALVVALAAQWIMAAIFGAPFAAAGPALAVLVWVFPLRFLTGHARWSLIADNQQGWLLKAEVLGSLTLVLVALATISWLAELGAALALIAGIVASGIATQWRAERTIGAMGAIRCVIWPLLAASVAGALALGLADEPLARAAIGAGVFAALGLIRFRALFEDLRHIAYAKTA